MVLLHDSVLSKTRCQLIHNSSRRICRTTVASPYPPPPPPCQVCSSPARFVSICRNSQQQSWHLTTTTTTTATTTNKQTTQQSPLSSPDKLLGEPQERLLEVVVGLCRNVVVLKVLLAVERDLLCLHFAVLDLHLSRHTQSQQYLETSASCVLPCSI